MLYFNEKFRKLYSDIFYYCPLSLKKKSQLRDFPGGAVIKNPPANAGDMGSSPVWEDPTCHGATKPMHHNY